MVDDFKLTPAVADAVRVTQYLSLASATLYLYDLLLTLHLEIDLLWPSKWTLIKVLYLLQRYLPLLDTVVIMMSWQFGEISNIQTCKTLFMGFGWSCLIGMTLSEVVLTCRTLAVWGNMTRIRIGLFLFSLSCMIPLYWTMAKESLAITYHSIPIPGMYCLATAGPGIRYLCWTLLTVYDLGLLILITTRAFRSRNSGRAIRRSTLSQVVYQDGVLYYLYLVALSTMNIALILSLPGNFATLLVTNIQRVSYSILTSRVVLHIRKQAYQTQVVMISLHPLDISAEAELRRSEV
ncbi:hypothetical protein BDN72DRAFT_847722 [Pluteus cervinus]|uniref:Uncharacterized protein n=1 Tax=Pluteus cervinus TaxID=181527 RepID=A0ACD3AC83_9AGAR|nr:hypothetical protein BDN72DRAFT_847722 [Pluteus cervinus]